MKNFKSLSRADMKKITGGTGGPGDPCSILNPCAPGNTCSAAYNGICEGSGHPCGEAGDFDADFTCCYPTYTEHLGWMGCYQATEICTGYKLTNDPSRC